MTKQGEIKLKACRLFCQHCQALQKTMGWEGKPCWAIQYNEPDAVCASAIDAIDGLFDYLHAQGVVIKVDRELPECPVSLEDGLSSEVRNYREYSIKQYCLAQLILLKAGYVATKPLIEKDTKEVK